jgi:hypothetical protein
VKQIILLSIVIMGLALFGVVHAAPLSFVSDADVTMVTSDAPASSTPAQLASGRNGCHCCWKTHRGVTRCKWMTSWRCRVRGGQCAQQSSPKS